MRLARQETVANPGPGRLRTTPATSPIIFSPDRAWLRLRTLCLSPSDLRDQCVADKPGQGLVTGDLPAATSQGMASEQSERRRYDPVLPRATKSGLSSPGLP